MVGSEEHQVVTLAHLLIECLEQSCNILIELQISLVGMLATGTIFVTNHIGLRVAYTKHISLVALTQVLA